MTEIDPNTFQWLVRSAYEAGWRDGGGDPAQSPSNTTPVGWRQAWLASQPRAFLLNNGFITGQDAYK